MGAVPDAHMKERMSACQKSWLALEERYRDNYTALLAEWSKFAEQCQGTTTYEFHHAGILQAMGKNREAAEYLAAALKRNLPNDTALRVSYASVRFSDVLLTEGRNMDKLRAVNLELEAVLRDHPDDAFALTEQARQLGMMRDFKGSFTAARKAADLDVNSWNARFWLVISASHIRECKVAQPYIVPAIQLHDALLGQQEFIYAATICYLEIGAVPTADYALRSLERRNSAVRQDPLFQQLLKATQEAKQGGSSSPP